MIQKPLRARSKAHCIWVASHPCDTCGRTDVQAHHLLTAQPKAMSKRAGDQWVFPLCVFHHTMLHSIGEKVYMKRHGHDDYLEHTTNLARESPVAKIREAAGR